jgi:hypothetical protein
MVHSGIQVAEGVGFEPTIRFPVYTLSKRAPSATRPSLRAALPSPASGRGEGRAGNIVEAGGVTTRSRARIGNLQGDVTRWIGNLQAVTSPTARFDFHLPGGA